MSTHTSLSTHTQAIGSVRDGSVRDGSARDGSARDGTLMEVARSVCRTTGRCPVCHFTEIRTDEVIDRDVVHLAECPRCQFRWTVARPDPVAAHVDQQVDQRLEQPFTPLPAPWPATRTHRVPARVAREVSPAA